MSKWTSWNSQAEEINLKDSKNVFLIKTTQIATHNHDYC